MIDLERHGTVAVVRLQRNVTNALSPELIGELSSTIERIAHDPATQAVVLTSASDKFFSIGWDIPQLYALEQEEFRRFFRSFRDAGVALYSLDKPTVAAITGHAIAGGYILALCCDHRIIAEGRTLVGLNEVKLGVPVPFFADCILRDTVGGRVAREVMEAGDFFSAEIALARGLVDRVLPRRQVVADAVEAAGAMGALPREAFAAIKRTRVERIVREVAGDRDERDRVFIDLWYSSATRARLADAMARF